MKIGATVSSPQISFQSGGLKKWFKEHFVECPPGLFNDQFKKRLNMAKEDDADAQVLLRCLHENTITYSEERLAQVKKALEESKIPSVKYFLKRIVEIWTEADKN